MESLIDFAKRHGIKEGEPIPNCLVLEHNRLWWLAKFKEMEGNSYQIVVLE